MASLLYGNNALRLTVRMLETGRRPIHDSQPSTPMAFRNTNTTATGAI